MHAPPTAARGDTPSSAASVQTRARVFSDSLLVFAANGLINAANLLLVLIAVHWLSKADYGVLGALLGCIGLATVVVNAAQLHLTRHLALHPGNRREYLAAVLRRAASGSAAVALVALLLIWPAAQWLAAGWVEWLLTCAVVIALLFASLANGVSSATLRWRLQSAAGVLGAVLKLALAGLLLYLGLGISGVLAGYFAGHVLVFLLTLPLLAETPDSAAPSAAAATPTARFGARFLLAYLALYAPYCLDQVLVQAAARPLSGDYSALCTLAKPIFMAVWPLLVVMYSHLANATGDAARQQRIYRMGLAATLLPACGMAAVLWLFAHQLAPLLLGARYAQTQDDLGLLAAGVVLYAAAHAIGLRLLALGTTAPLLITAALLPLQAALIALRGGTLRELVENQLLTFSLQLGLLVASGLAQRCQRPTPHAE